MRAIPSPSPATEPVFRRVFLAAILAGLVAGVLVTGLQAARLKPLIAVAEKYEDAMPGHVADEGWTPAPGQRTAYTLLANLVIATGFGLLLSGGFALRQAFSGNEAGAREGLLWGLAGFACFSLAPSFGLPPELPGSVAAGLGARQAWWLGTALATAAGIGLIAFARGWTWRVLAIALLALPHIVGAPQPSAEGGAVPATLAAQFAAASLAIAALFWIVLGSVGGWLYERLGRAREAVRS
jgi:cobalt transporter subunit CbtA